MPDRDPKGFAVGSDGLAVIATLQEIVMARDGNRVSAFKPSYEPTAVSYHPTQPEVVIGGKVCILGIYYECNVNVYVSIYRCRHILLVFCILYTCVRGILYVIL